MDHRCRFIGQQGLQQVEILPITHVPERSGGPAAHPRIRIPQKRAEQRSRLGKRVERQRVQGLPLQISPLEGESLLRNGKGLVAGEPEQERQQPRPGFFRRHPFQRHDHLLEVRLEAGQRSDCPHARAPVRVDQSLKQRLDSPSVAEKSESEGRRTTHGGLRIHQQLLQGRQPLRVADPPQGLCQIDSQLRVSMARHLHRKWVELPPILQQQEHSALLQIGNIPRITLDSRPWGRCPAARGQDQGPDNRESLDHHGPHATTLRWR